MDPAALTIDTPRDWLHAGVGIVLFLLPGVAAADRLLPKLEYRWALAPVFAATLYPVGGLLLDFVGVPVRPLATALIGLLWTGLFARRRLGQWLDRRVTA